MSSIVIYIVMYVPVVCIMLWFNCFATYMYMCTCILCMYNYIHYCKHCTYVRATSESSVFH